jgi:hypothetical protein
MDQHIYKIALPQKKSQVDEDIKVPCSFIEPRIEIYRDVISSKITVKLTCACIQFMKEG